MENSLAQLREIAWGFGPALVAETALKLGLFDCLERTPSDVPALSAYTGCSERGLRATLNVLVGIGLLNIDSSGRFTLTATSRALLVSTKPDFQGGALQNISETIRIWLRLTEAVRTGMPVANFEQECSTGTHWKESVEGLFRLNYPATVVLARKLNLKYAGRPIRVLDVAAGSGVWGIGLAKASQFVRVTAIDRAPVLEVASRIAKNRGVEDQVLLVPGDVHTVDLGSGYDVIVMGHILHSEGEKRSRDLLIKAFNAVRPGGSIVIADFLVNNDRSAPLLSLLFAVWMLLTTENGETFSFEEIDLWLRDAGFSETELVAAPAPSPLIIARRPA